MKSRLGYDVSVRHSIPASVALFALLVVWGIFVSSSAAQINGAPASVTSPGFGGHAINGPRASVTSLGPNGYAPGVTFSGPGFPHDGRRGNGQGEHHHHFVPYVPPLYYAVPLPYAVDIGATDDGDGADRNPQDQDQDSDYQGGPTVFDRRGSGRDSYVPPVRDIQPSHSSERTDEAPTPSDPLEPTTLVFKDGHKLEVGNYAIIGQTLFDMTPGHAHKVPLASLDLEATRRQNDERGVTFQLPISSQAN
jgi:hypothetical protein